MSACIFDCRILSPEGKSEVGIWIADDIKCMYKLPRKNYKRAKFIFSINDFRKWPWRSYEFRRKLVYMIVKKLKKIIGSIILTKKDFYPLLCFKLAKILKHFNFKVIFKPVNKFNFPSTKSPIPEFHKWGIYKVPCKDCNLFYNQTKRNLETSLSVRK